jgi:hypothetical protein
MKLVCLKRFLSFAQVLPPAPEQLRSGVERFMTTNHYQEIFMNMFRASLMTLLVLWGSSAYSQSVSSTYDKDYNLSRLKTYDYKVEDRDRTDPLATDTLTEQKIREALEEALNANAYHQASGAPDFLVSYHITTKDVTSGRRVPFRGLPGPRGNLQIETYIQGTLIVDFIDPETKRLIWRGVASGIVGREAVDFKVAEEKIKAACKSLLEQFRKDPGRF